MDVEDGVEEVVVHILERLVTEDTSVVNDHVDAPVLSDDSLDNSLTIFCAGLDAERIST